ncbi:phosphonate ABC transporter, inner membrane subunit [Alkaliphilus metalliredigens QYMF]|uniref:Phosphonate ABC transporter, inner membrane subunit n=1 Tax=Alkaliphilus metalliredigens (strain QYMF) TaxID=293826 RepID=A6TMF2_ALKMQ|nr:phosphonate ABC transporter, permease protein PhnE [Alkaliphilus metalliredigens]ABR47370.1 phosphonate ABC transporter, inner membrane subunit [Alkaliphilus metalliredigens QYMF]
MSTSLGKNKNSYGKFFTNKRFAKKTSFIVMSALFLFSFSQLDFTIKKLLNGFERGQYMLERMLPPVVTDLNALIAAALESIQVAVVSTILGVAFSAILAIFAANNTTPHQIISYLIKGFAVFVRSIPALIWAIMFIVAVGFGPSAGIMALAINSIGMLVKVYAESIEEMDKGVIEALRATGASPFQVAMQGILPAVMSILISWSVFRLDINIRYAAILGVVGAGGIGAELDRYTRASNYDQALGVTIIIFLMVIFVEKITTYIKQQLDLPTTALVEGEDE